MTIANTMLNRNRTGVSRDPDMAKDMMKGSKHRIDGTDRAEFVERRLDALRSNPLASTMPPPAHMAKVRSLVLLDKLGERLAFERAGVRLYDTLLLKHDATGGFPGGPSRADLEEIREDELAHFALLESIIGRFGGDPTAVTPSANLAIVENTGVCSAINDPRTSLAEGLHAILIAELADNDAWEQLIELVDQLGEEELAEGFREAYDEEQEHLARVRGWLAADLSARLHAEELTEALPGA
jgi:rubrerythrin